MACRVQAWKKFNCAVCCDICNPRSEGCCEAEDRGRAELVVLWLPPNTNRVRFVASVAQDDLPMVQTSDSSKQVFRLRLAPSKYVDYNSVLDRPGALPFGGTEENRPLNKFGRVCRVYHSMTAGGGGGATNFQLIQAIIPKALLYMPPTELLSYTNPFSTTRKSPANVPLRGL